MHIPPAAKKAIPWRWRQDEGERQAGHEQQLPLQANQAPSYQPSCCLGRRKQQSKG